MITWGLLAVIGCGSGQGIDSVEPVEAPPPQIDQVCINELMVRSEVEFDWLELSGEPGFILDGWSVLWSRDADPKSHSLDGMALGPTGFLQLTADGTDETADLPFSMDGDGEEVGLQAPDDTREWITWTSAASEHSLARSPDCCRLPNCWIEVLGGTPGSSNGETPL